MQARHSASAQWRSPSLYYSQISGQRSLHRRPTRQCSLCCRPQPSTTKGCNLRCRPQPLATLGRSLLLVVLLWSATFQSSAQQLPRKQLLGTRDGLSHRWIFHAMVDPQGFLWISTFDGLNRYDGRSFDVFRHNENDPESLLSSTISNFSIAPDGKIWCNTFRGISVLDPQQRRCRNYPLSTFADSSLLRIRELYCLRGSWVAMLFERGERSQLHLMDAAGRQRSLPDLTFAANETRIIGQGRNPQELVLFSQGRYVIVDLQHGRAFRPPPASQPGRPADPRLPIDEQQRFWYYAEGRLQAAELPAGFEHSPRWQWHVDQYGHYYLYNNQWHQLYRLDPRQGHFRLQGDQLDTDYCLTDQRGIGWVCSQQGLLKLVAGSSAISTRLSQPFSNEETPPITFACRDLLELPGGSVLALNQSGNGRLAGGQRPQAYSRLQAFAQAHRLYSPISGRDGRYWFCADYQQRTQLVAYDAGRDQLHFFPSLPLPRANDFEPSNHLFEDRQGRLWLVSNNYVQYFSPRQQRFFPLREQVGYPHCLHYDPADDRFYSIEGRQLYIYDCRREQLLSRRELSFLANNELLHAREIIRHRDKLWLATTAGLASIDLRSGAERLYTTADGLPTNLLYSLLADGDYLWLGTADGLCRYHLPSGRTLVFSVDDGLAHPEFNSRSKLTARDGRLWMGGLNGISIFDPRQLDSFRLQAPRVLLSSGGWTRAGNSSPLPGGEPLQLPHDYTSLQFRFCLDNFLQPEGHRFSYRLLPLHHSWMPWQADPDITFQGLAAGSYQLEVRGMDERGVMSEQSLRLPFVIRQVWWKQAWAKVAYVLLLLLLGLAIFRFQLRQRLAQAENSRLRALDTLKNKLYANITHEFRTPLTLIIGPTERLQKHEAMAADPGLRQSVQTIQQNARRLLSLVNQILDLRKLEVRGLDLRPEPTELIGQLRLLTESFRSIAEDKGIALAFCPEPDRFDCLLDRDKLYKIVSNLLSNACKFTPAGGDIRLSVSVEPLAGDQRLLRLQVADSGLGIAPHELSHIFDPFYQSDNNYLLSSEGSGIGLTLVKELAELMGGSVRVESKLGAGSIFEVKLPVGGLAVGDAAAGENAAAAGRNGVAAEAATAAASTTTPEGSTPLVLLIEDNQEIARYIGSCLETQYRLLFAYDGDEGIRMALRYCPDLILTDWMMPRRDGLEVTHTLKSDPRSSHIPILLLTARAEVQDRLSGLRAGADAYLAKPFAEEELQLTITNLLRLREALRKRYALLPYRPAEDGETDSLSPEDEFVAKTQTFFMDNLSNSGLSMEALYRHLAMSHTQVHRKLLALTGRTPLQWLRELRLQRAQQLLQEGRLSVGEVADRCGFADAAYFSRVFARAFGVPPSAWREKAG